MSLPNVKLFIRFSLHMLLIAGLLAGFVSVGVPQSTVEAKVSEIQPVPEQSQFINQPSVHSISDSDEPEPGTFLPKRQFQDVQSTAFDEITTGFTRRVDEIKPPEDLVLTGTGSPALTSARSATNLLAGIDPNSLPAGKITIDLTYDVVIGWVDAGENVTVETSGYYGTAVADGIGFFWTPIWSNIDGHQIGIDCGMTLSISIAGGIPFDITPPCLKGSIDVLTDTIYGNITPATTGLSVGANLGDFNISTGGMPPSPGAPSGSGTTDINGDFSIGITGVDFGAESLVALDFDHTGVNIRNYVIPHEVFMIQQMNSIAGYTAIGQTITATIYEGDSSIERWSGITTAIWPHGYFLFSDDPFTNEDDIALYPGDKVEIELVGNPLPLSTIVPVLGGLSFDAAENSMHGNAPTGRPIRGFFWQWEGKNRVYSEVHTTASETGFSIDFSPVDLKARTDVLVVAADSSGNQVQILSGPAYVGALTDPLSDMDCVYGRLDAPYVPIYVSLFHGGQIYTRVTDWFSDAGNDYNVCFIMRDHDWAWGPINFETGDIVTLSSDTENIASVTVIEFDWAVNPATDTISGEAMPAGDVELLLYQWMSDRFPLYGTATQQADVSSEAFLATFNDFDVRDGLVVDLSHYDTKGNGNTLYSWGQSALPYFELQIAHNAISGIVGNPGDTVSAQLYDGDTLLAETSDDGNDDPYQFWLGDFGGHSLQPEYRVVVRSTSGWYGEMIVPKLIVSGDYATETITGSGPEGLLFVDTYRDDANFGLFVPSLGSGDVVLDAAFYGYDLHQGDYVALTYQAPDGNRARQEVRLGDLFLVGHWFDYGSNDWMWGEAQPGTTVTLSINSGPPISTSFTDPNCQSCWGIEEPLDLNPGDMITVSVNTGFSITYQVPTPLTSVADSVHDTITGRIGGRVEDWVNINTWWDGREHQVTTISDGSYILQSEPDNPWDVPVGGEGNILFSELHSNVTVNFLQHFISRDLILNVNYDHDWIEGNYASGYDVTLTVTESDGITTKASTKITTGPIPWWGGGTGFSTNMDDVVWDLERPDIQPGDWVFGKVTVDETTYYAEVHLGTISGRLDAETNAFIGTLAVPWLPQDQTVTVQCHPWGAPPETNGKEMQVLPNGEDLITCDWTGEWDVKPNEQIAVLYQAPGGHWVYSVHNAYTDELILQVHYDHDWIQGYYEADHDIYLQVNDSLGFEKSHITFTSREVEGWNGQTGFSTNMDGAEWVPGHPDIEPGDAIYGSVDGGAHIAMLEIGYVTGITNVAADTVTGTLDADWMLPGPVEINCQIWEENAPERKSDSITPDGADPYMCSWDGEWDMVPGSQVMVAYYEPAGHEVIGDFSPPAPHLRIEKWLDGNGNPGEGGNAAFYIRYVNQGGDVAENVTIIDTLLGMNYLGDTSGISPSGGGSSVTWEIGDVAPGDWIQFIVYAQVTTGQGDPISNTAEITTSDPYDMGEDWEKITTWEGSVAENDTYLNIGINPWTWNPASGHNYVYAYNVCNNGSTSSSSVILALGFSTNIIFEDWWAREDGWTLNSLSWQPPELEHPSIPGGQCYEVYARVRVDTAAEPGDELVATADIFAANDLSYDDNYSELRHKVGSPNVDLSVSANWHSGSLVPGGDYRYGLNFRNNGNVGITDHIEITTTIPTGTTYAGWDHWDYGIFAGEPVVNGNQITWQVNGLDAGYYGTIEVWLNIDGNTLPGTLLFHQVEIEIQPEESNIDNNFSSFEEYVYEHGPNLRIRKWGDWHGFGEGHNAWYQIQVENIGDETVDDVVVRDDYPAQMLLDGGLSVGFWEWWTWEHFLTPLGNYFTVTLDRLEPGWNVNIYFNTVIPGSDPVVLGQVFTNKATVTLNSADANPLDNAAEFLLGTGPDMYVEKTLAKGEFKPGEQVEFLLTFGNAQPGHTWWWNMTGNAILVDSLPEGMTFVSSYIHCYQPGYEWCENTPIIDSTGKVLTWLTWPMGSGEQQEILLTITIDDELQVGNELINSIIISSDLPTVDLDPFPENNISSYTPHLELEAPVITSGDMITFVVGDSGTFTVVASGKPTPAITHTGTLPGGVSLIDQGDGTAILSGVPAIGSGGVYNLTITASNGMLPDDTQSFILTVNEKPAITSLAFSTFQAGVSGSFDITTRGYPSPHISITSGSLPTGLIFDDNGDGTATISGTPAVGSGGVYNLILTASNGATLNATQNFTLLVNEIPAFTSLAFSTFQVGVVGGFTISTSGYPSPTVSLTSSSLPTGLSFRAFGNGTATISGSPAAGTGGIYNLILTASNGLLPSATQNFVLTVNEAPTITSVDNINFTVGKEEKFAVEVSGNPIPTIKQLGSLPGGVSFADLGNGIAFLSGTPERGSGGVYILDITANNGVFPDDTQTFTLTVIEDLSFTSFDFCTVQADIPGSCSITTVGFPLATISITNGSTPTGLIFSDNGNGTATISGTPAAGTGGVYHLEFTASNGFAPDVTQNFTLLVNEAPKITSSDTTTFTVGSAGTFTITTYGYPSPTISITSGSLPTGLVFDDNGDGTATISGTPAVGTGGVRGLILTASDGSSLNSTQNFTLLVNEIPAITSLAYSKFQAGVVGGFTITASGYPFPTVSLTSGSLPTGLSFRTIGTGFATITGMPAAGTGGVYNLELTASNGLLPNATQNFVLTVYEAPKITSSDTITFTVGSAGIFTITTSGYPSVISISKSGLLPSMISLVDQGDGTAILSGTPLVASEGDYPITITASNGIEPPATQNFRLTIVTASLAPTITSPDNTTFEVGSLGSFSVITTGYPPVNSLTYTGTLPNGVTLSLAGLLSGIPEAGMGGVYVITITASNGVSPDATQEFTLTVNEAPKITSVDNTTFTAGEPGSFTITTTGYRTSAITTGDVLPTWLTLVDQSDGTAILSGTPPDGSSGVEYFVIDARNGVGYGTSQPFTLTWEETDGFTIFLPLILR